MQNINVKTTYPTDRPNFNDWCKEFKFGCRHIDRSGVHNAQRIMALWDGFLNTKINFVTKSLNEAKLYI